MGFDTRGSSAFVHMHPSKRNVRLCEQSLQGDCTLYKREVLKKNCECNTIISDTKLAQNILQRQQDSDLVGVELQTLGQQSDTAKTGNFALKIAG